jgi:hypothetical protein
VTDPARPTYSIVLGLLESAPRDDIKPKDRPNNNRYDWRGLIV